MQLPDLLEACRQELDDVAAPHLWSDEQLVRYLNEAIRQACVRARLLVESTHPMCAIAIVAGQDRYQLDPSVIIVRRAALRSRPSDPLFRTNTASLDRFRCNWRDEQGRPEFAVTDQQGAGRLLLLTPKPTETDTLDLTVLRYPTEDEELVADDDTSEPVIALEHHEALVHWVCHRAFRSADQEASNTSRANDKLALFEEHFGPMPTAAQLQALAIDRLTGTEPHWF